MEAECNKTLPVSEKYMLTIKEAAAYFNIGIKRLRRIAEDQLQRTSDMRYIIETTKTDAGTRVLPITEDVAEMFQAIIEDRNASKVEENGHE